MATRSAGLLIYRKHGGACEVFLVHPGGPFWARKDAGAWSIPKGELEGGEDPEAAARREFAEETGRPWEGTLRPLEPVRQPGGKVVLAYAGEGEIDPTQVHSNTFTMEWPPRSGRQQAFPEVDRAAWFDLQTARVKLHKGLQGLIDQLERLLGEGG